MSLHYTIIYFAVNGWSGSASIYEFPYGNVCGVEFKKKVFLQTESHP